MKITTPNFINGLITRTIVILVITVIIFSVISAATRKPNRTQATRDHLNHETKSDMYAFVAVDGQAFTLLGENAKGDTAIRFYYYNSASTATDDGENVIKPTSVSGAGRYLKIPYLVTSGDINNALGFTPVAQVNSDWNSGSGVSQILNKPTIPTNTNQLTNGSGFITSEVDGSTTNEIELPTLSGNSGKFLTNNGSASSWEALKRVEHYNSTTNASGLYTVTYGTAFGATPNVQFQIVGGSVTNTIRLTASSTTGFTVHVQNRVDVVGLLPTYNNVSGATVDVLVVER